MFTRRIWNLALSLTTLYKADDVLINQHYFVCIFRELEPKDSLQGTSDLKSEWLLFTNAF